MSDSAEPTIEPAAVAPTTTPEPAPVVEPEPAVELNIPEPESVKDPEPKTFTADYVKKLREEAADARVKGNEKAATAAKEAAEKAATDTQQALVEKWGRELGLIKDEDTAPKAEDIIAKLTAERDDVAKRETDTARRLRELTEHNALRDAADIHGGDFANLSDSKDLGRKLAALDHLTADYPAQVEAAVSAALDDNPKFRKEKTRPAAAARSGADLSAGNGAAAPIGDDTSVDALREHRSKRRGRR